MCMGLENEVYLVHQFRSPHRAPHSLVKPSLAWPTLSLLSRNKRERVGYARLVKPLEAQAGKG